jgi:hypothetical protein
MGSCRNRLQRGRVRESRLLQSVAAKVPNRKVRGVKVRQTIGCKAATAT